MTDIQELIADDEINEVDLVAMTHELLLGDNSDDLSDVEHKNFSLKNVEKALNMVKQLQEYILKNYSPHQKIHKDLRNNSKQTSMDAFSIKKQ